MARRAGAARHAQRSRDRHGAPAADISPTRAAPRAAHAGVERAARMPVAAESRTGAGFRR